MKDVSDKIDTLRTATARAVIKARADTVEVVKSNEVPKGNVLEMARAAGIMAAKKTSELIPLCHQIPIDTVHIDLRLEKILLLLNLL